MPMLVVYTYVCKIWRGLLSIIKWRRSGIPCAPIIAAVSRFFYALKLPVYNPFASAIISYHPINNQLLSDNICN